jgi:hypothetical protein
MDDAFFLIVLGAFAILYAAGWFVISLPEGKRREAMRRSWLGIRHTIVAPAAAPSRQALSSSDK